jgi:F0F1-type ATP synthase membrane subunit b/b'
MDMFSGVLGLIVIFFLFVLAVLWFFLPFAIFGTKDKLAALITESKKTNAELARVVAELAATRAEMAQRRPTQAPSGNV